MEQQAAGGDGLGNGLRHGLMHGSRPGLGAGQVLLASIGRRLVRYRRGDEGDKEGKGGKGGHGFIERDSLETPFAVQYACFHPDRPIAYVACSNGGVASPGDAHCLLQVALDDTGMRLLAQPLALPYRPLHAAVDVKHKRLALAYNRPAAVTVHGLDADGLVQGQPLLAQGPGQVGHFPHQIIPLPGTGHWLLTCRGDDPSPTSAENPGGLRVLRDDGQTLACVQTVAPNAGYGFGPRNCAFHPHRQVLYAVLERQNRLAAFQYGPTGIEPEPFCEAELLACPTAVRRPQLAGAIALHPTGRFAYVVNRAHPVPDRAGKAVPCGENSIVVFHLDEQTGAASELQRMPLNGLHARCLALSADGTRLVAALRQAGRCLADDGGVLEYAAGFAVFSIAASGRLTLAHQDEVEVGEAQLFWADFVPPYAGTP